MLTEVLIAVGLLIIAVLLGIWIGSAIWGKYKNLAEEWSREYHEKLETYTGLQEAHDTLNTQYNKDKEAMEGIQAKLANSITQRSSLEQEMGEMRQHMEQARQQAANSREEVEEIKKNAALEVKNLKTEFDKKTDQPLTQVPIVVEPVKPVEEVVVHQERLDNVDRGDADRQRLTELEGSIGRLKNQILLLMPFQGKFERALKEMEALRRSEASMKEQLAAATISAEVSQKALKEAASKVKSLGNVDELYVKSQDQIHKLNLALGIVRPYKEKAEKLEKELKAVQHTQKSIEQKQPAQKKKPSQQHKPVEKKQAVQKKAPKPVAPKTKAPQEKTAKKPTTRKPAAVKKTAPKKPSTQPVADKPKQKPKTKQRPPKTSKADTLARIKAKAGEVDFKKIGTATASQKDDLKKIKGIGPFLEEKLNSIGIYNFDQISRFTPAIEKKVNDIIEFFPGRIKRDGWKRQASDLVKAKNKQ